MGWSLDTLSRKDYPLGRLYLIVESVTITLTPILDIQSQQDTLLVIFFSAHMRVNCHYGAKVGGPIIYCRSRIILPTSQIPPLDGVCLRLNILYEGEDCGE